MRSKEAHNNIDGVRSVQSGSPLLPRTVLLGVTSSLMTGCSFAGAPSFELFGAFFPAWMLCALIGILGAAVARVILTVPTLNGTVPFQLAVGTAVAVTVALLAWAVLFG